MVNIVEHGTEHSEDPFNIPVNALGINTLEIISRLLNPLKVIPTIDKLSRDWQGLAALIGFNGEEISCFITERNPTLTVLKKWHEKERSTIRSLLMCLEKIDRFDVIDDISELLDFDVDNYSSVGTKNLAETQPFMLGFGDFNAYERGLPPETYDACILYANEDVDFASTLVEKMEKEFSPPLKIFVKDRDLFGGAIEHSATIKLIAKRCNRLIVILSPAFVQSSENAFFINFAQSIGIDQRRRKIIPCLYSPCEIPAELRPLHMLDYGRSSGPLFNFWEKLHKSILTPVTDTSLGITRSNRSLGQSESNLTQSHDADSAVNLSANMLPIEPVINSNSSTTNVAKANKSKLKFSLKSFMSLPRSLVKHRKKEKVPVLVMTE